MIFVTQLKQGPLNALYNIERFADEYVPATGTLVMSEFSPERVGIVDGITEDEFEDLTISGRVSDDPNHLPDGRRFGAEGYVEVATEIPEVERRWPLADGRLLRIIRNGEAYANGSYVRFLLSDTDAEGDADETTVRSVTYNLTAVKGYDATRGRGLRHLRRPAVEALLEEVSDAIDTIGE
jgi:hypothetical protein